MRRRWFLLLVMATGLLGVLHAWTWAQQRAPVTIEGKSVLPLRVLARPFSHIYKEPDASKGTVEENVPTFQTYFVYTRPESKATTTDVKGWYEVGKDNRGGVLGWMKAEDVLEWKQTMSLAYTHPAGRHPVLMFEQHGTLLELVKSAQRQGQAEKLYADINAGQKLPPTFPIRSVEPKKFVDITKQFYLLPILEFGDIELEGREGRILKLAAATLTDREKTVLTDNAAYRTEATQDMTEITSEKLQTLEVDVVFVMDMTASMQPYIDATRDTIRDIALGITKNPAVRQSVYFGLWGYRDSKDIPALEFNTKNFTPTLQQVSDFEKTLQSAKDARVGSEDYPEDVFSGIDNAMNETKWHSQALRFIILVGDAPSHEMGHPRNYSGKNEKTLRGFADDHHIYIFALHVRNPDPRVTPFHRLAEEQFRHLSSNKGQELASYYGVDSTDLNGFAQSAKNIAGALVQIVEQAKRGRVVAPPPASAAGGARQAPGAAELAAKMAYAALVEWIGRETDAKAPRDIIAWAIDKDLLDPSIQSMDVRVLINKSDLDSLKTVLSATIAAGRRGQIGGEKFFNSLQATAATLTRNPEQIKNAGSFADAGLLPEFLIGLPYKSQLMAMTNDLWASWSNDDQDGFLKDLEAKVRLYSNIHDTPEGWILLHKGDDPNEAVYPISLEMLP